MVVRFVRRTLIASCLAIPAISSGSLFAQVVSAGDENVTADGVVDGWTNVLYINEARPFDFSGTGQSQGMLTSVNFWVDDSRVAQSVITPFIAEPLVEDPSTGADFVIRAIGTTRDQASWKCGGEYQFPFHDTEKFAVQNGWVVGFLTSDPLSERADALSPVPFVPDAGVDGWLTGTSTAGNGVPVLELNQPIVEGASGTEANAYGFRDYQFRVQAQAGNVQPPVPAGGRVGGACPVDQIRTGNIAGTFPLKGQGGPDGWTNVLYINEAEPFDFAEFGTTEGKLSEFNFWAATADAGMVTPFVAEPLVADPQTGDDFVIRAIGTTRVAGEDWDATGEQTFAFSDTESFTAKNGWLAGFLTSDPDGQSDLARSPIPFVGSTVEGWLTGSSAPATGVPAIAVGQPITEGGSGTFVEGAGKRRYQFNIMAEGKASLPGDYNSNGQLDASDIDALTAAVLAGDTATRYDLDNNGAVNAADRTMWVESLKKTYLGDANLDGQFNSTDLIFVFQRGKYEDTVEDNATWEDGDWDGDRDFNSSDFVIAFQGAGYESGPRAATSTVPEPTSSCILTALTLLGIVRSRRKLRS